MDTVERIDGVYTGFVGYAMFYPFDGLLVTCADLADAQKDLATAQKNHDDPRFKNAYIVEVHIREVVDA